VAGYRLAIKRSAAKEIEGVEPVAVRRRLVARIRALARDPRPPGAEKLAGRTHAYRVRQGSFRILYEIDDRAGQIVVVKVGHRREVYR
jgi:mRNA interferase RelE/StbE